MLIAFNKPYGVLSQFTREGERPTLAEFKFPDYVYPIGRLDADSEGLLLLTDEAGLNNRLLDPQNAHSRTYWAQVERIPPDEKIKELERGVKIGDRVTMPCGVRIIPEPEINDRIPPIRFRKTVPTSWLELRLIEGKNRQVRRMTAYIGHPTLRLIRVAICNYSPKNLVAGTWRALSDAERRLIFSDI